ncbi:hypothetical protein WJX79_002094 [Trebouxia sp. C0005]
MDGKTEQDRLAKVFSGPQVQVQAHPSHSKMRASQSSSSPRDVQTSERASVTNAATHAQQRTDSSRPTLLSPFATCEVQDSQAQPEEIKPVSSRKRARCQSADLDITPLTKLAQLTSPQSQSNLMKTGPALPGVSTPRNANIAKCPLPQIPLSYVLPTTLAVPFTPLNPMANPMAHSLAATQQTVAFGGAAQHVLTPGVTYAHSMAGLGPMGLGSAGGLSAMGLGLSSTFGMTQAGYNILPRVPLTMAPSMVPSMQVNPQDKAQCLASSTNVRIY